nr:MAG TPA: hypothetical protein [Caudoviricetes sp.]
MYKIGQGVQKSLHNFIYVYLPKTNLPKTYFTIINNSILSYCTHTKYQ